MEDIVDRAKKKGRFKAKVVGIVGDVEYIIKLYSGLPFPSGSHVRKMIDRYDAEVFRENKFKYVGVYRSALDVMANRRELPEVNINDLKKVKVELLRYFHHVKGE